MNLCVFVVRCLGVRVTGSKPPTDAVMPPMDEAVRLFAAHGAGILGHHPRSATSPSWAPDRRRRTHASHKCLREQCFLDDPDARALPNRALGGAVSHDPLVRAALPSGTVTFLFTDVEASTRLLEELGSDRYAVALADHRRIVREACVSLGGVEVDTQGDAFSLRLRGRRTRFKRPR